MVLVLAFMVRVCLAIEIEECLVVNMMLADAIKRR